MIQVYSETDIYNPNQVGNIPKLSGLQQNILGIESFGYNKSQSMNQKKDLREEEFEGYYHSMNDHLSP